MRCLPSPLLTSAWFGLLSFAVREDCVCGDEDDIDLIRVGEAETGAGIVNSRTVTVSYLGLVSGIFA